MFNDKASSKRILFRQGLLPLGITVVILWAGLVLTYLLRIHSWLEGLATVEKAEAQPLADI